MMDNRGPRIDPWGTLPYEHNAMSPKMTVYFVSINIIFSLLLILCIYFIEKYT